jgi:5-methylcytosine-specific restriction endonuclease McrA
MAFTKQQRIEIHAKFGGKCAYCGADIQLKDMQVDHIIPQRNFERHVHDKSSKVPEFLRTLSIFDVDNINNLHPACRTCNKWKDTFDLETFRNELSKQTERLNLYSANYRIAKMYNQIIETKEKIVFFFEK